jgi:hypothetical protein
LTILNESGTPDVLSPLCGLHALAGRLPDALLVMAGIRADIHLAQSLSVPLPGAPADPRGQNGHNSGGYEVHPRVVFIVLEPDEEPSGGALASRVIEAAAGFRHTGLVLLVACRSVGLLGFDAGFEAELAERRLGLPVRALLPDPDTGGVLSTDLEDAAVRVLLDLSPSNVPEPEEERPYYSKGGLLGKLPLRSRPGRRTAEETGARRPVVLLGGPAGPREIRVHRRHDRPLTDVR